MSQYVVATYPHGLRPPAGLWLRGMQPWTLHTQGEPGWFRFTEFAIDWVDGSGNIALHVNPRPEQGVVVLNNSSRGAGEPGWGDELVVQRYPFGLELCVAFDFRFEILADRFRLSVDGAHLCDFAHRAAPSAIRAVQSSIFLAVLETDEAPGEALEHGL